MADMKTEAIDALIASGKDVFPKVGAPVQCGTHCVENPLTAQQLSLMLDEVSP